MIIYAMTAVFFLVIDAIMLTLVMKPLFTRHLGDAMRDRPMSAPAGPVLSRLCGRACFSGLGPRLARCGPGTCSAAWGCHRCDGLRDLRVHLDVDLERLVLADGRNGYDLGRGADEILCLGRRRSDFALPRLTLLGSSLVQFDFTASGANPETRHVAETAVAGTEQVRPRHYSIRQSHRLYCATCPSHTGNRATRKLSYDWPFTEGT